MNGVAVREGVLAALASYLLILSAHALLPDTVAFAAVLALVVTALHASRAAPRPASEIVTDVTVPPLESMTETLAALEAELHALRDQQLTDEARAGGAVGSFDIGGGGLR